MTIKRITSDEFGAHLAPQFTAMTYFAQCDADGTPITIIAAAHEEWVDAVACVVEPHEVRDDATPDNPHYATWQFEVAQGETMFGFADWLDAGDLLAEAPV
jgi:hypothetical protein